MDEHAELLLAFREQLGRALQLWRPAAEDVRRFHERLHATLERVKADGSPLTLVEQVGDAIAAAETPFEAFAHLAVLEVYAKASGNERLLRYCRLVTDVSRILGSAVREQHPGEPIDALSNLRLAGKMIAAVAAMDRDEPRLADAKLLAFASTSEVAAAIAGAVLQMLADLRGETPS